MAPALIPCAHCGCHAKSIDPLCPECGEPLHLRHGSVQRPAVAVLLGLTAVGALAGACSSSGGGGGSSTTSVTNTGEPAYGIAMSTTATGTGGSGTGGSGTGGSSGDAGSD